jgi:DNA (cytosine-5)-methyltransferase 1
MRSIELFAGAAGLGMGLAKAGFHHEIVVERDHEACETIRHNQRRDHPLVKDWQVVEADVANVDLSAVAPEPDLLSGGPPCQPFSAGGAHAGASDERNCWPWTINATRVLRPRAFLFENVPGMLRHKEYLDYLIMALTVPELANPTADWREDAAFLRKCIDQGVTSPPRYRVAVERLTATDFGVAQARSRVFIVGMREDVAGEWRAPEATHSARQLLDDKWINGSYWERHGMARPDIDTAGLRHLRAHNKRPVEDLFARRMLAHLTVRDAIGDLPEATAAGSPGILNHEAATREAKAYKGHTGSAIDEPSKTLRAGVHGVSGGENMVDYGEGSTGARYRHFTVREAARIMGVDDDYAFPGTWSDGLKQMGNAVCPPMAQAIGETVRTALSA